MDAHHSLAARRPRHRVLAGATLPQFTNDRIDLGGRDPLVAAARSHVDADRPVPVLGSLNIAHFTFRAVVADAGLARVGFGGDACQPADGDGPGDEYCSDSHVRERIG